MNDLRYDPDDDDDGPAPAVLDPVYLDGLPVIDPAAERTAFLRQWQPVAPDAPRSNTELHTPDGVRYINAEPAPDLRTVGDKLADLVRRVERIEVAVERIADAVQVLMLQREGA